jgi:hypothetical protein
MGVVVPEGAAGPSKTVTCFADAARVDTIAPRAIVTIVKIVTNGIRNLFNKNAYLLIQVEDSPADEERNITMLNEVIKRIEEVQFY